MAKQNTDFTLSTAGLDDLFSSQEERDDAKLERVQNIPLDQLHPFKDHPFKIQNDEEMERMIESVKTVGAITPALARPLPNGGYELISGHRRLAACQAAGLETMPVIIRDMTDDEAIIAMVDANLQREHILPSEKAFAYKMKLEALSHQGITCGQVGHKSRDTISNDDSGRQIQRYVRLTQMEYDDCTPNLSQAQRLKTLSGEGRLTTNAITEIMGEEKANQKERIKIPADRVRKFFPKNYTTAQMEDAIVKMCEERYRKRLRDRGAR